MDYKEKYENGVECIQEILSGGADLIRISTLRKRLQPFFPELKEDENNDEKIGKEIIDFVKSRGGFKGDWIAWLEKQEENKSVDKPKFKVGDWILNDVCFPLQIASIRDGMYVFTEGDAISVSFVDEHLHLWTIQDAMDGDVLMTTKTRNCPFIYRKTDYNNNLAYYYAGINGSGDFCEGCIKRTLYHFGPLSNVVPATKEQQDLLFAKMKEAGYEWDGNKKELKKIEPKKLDADDILPYLGNNQVQDILEDMGMLDDNGRCPHTAEEIFKAGMEHAFNLNREAASSVKVK